MRRMMLPAISAGLLALATLPAYAGQVSIVGTGDGMDMLRALAATYSTENPKTIITVPASIGSGGGVAAVGSDKEVLGRVARPLSASEAAQGLIYTPVLSIPSAIFVHPTARVKGLTSTQLVSIYNGTVTNWKDVGGADLPIKVVRREDVDSTLAVLRGSMPGWKDLVITTKSKMAVTTQEALESVADIEGAIGFGPFSSQLEPAMTVLKIDNRTPSEPGYPSAVKLAFIHKSATLTPEAKAFMEFARTEKARQLISSMGGVAIAD